MCGGGLTRGAINHTRATSPQCVAVDNDIIFYDEQGMRKERPTLTHTNTPMRAAGQSVKISCFYGFVVKTLSPSSEVTFLHIFRVD